MESGIREGRFAMSHECYVTRKFPSLAASKLATNGVVKERRKGRGTQWEWLDKKDFGAKDFPLHDYPAWSSAHSSRLRGLLL